MKRAAGRGLLAAMSALAGAVLAGEPPHCDESLRAGGYLLCTQVLHAGTRSEGRVGRLFLDGRELTGRKVGEVIDVRTPERSVRFTFLGAARPHLWSHSGWMHDR